jgi:DNA-binding GntR family transcriptional regulator
MAQTDRRLVQLIDHQSQRMDRMDKFYEDWLRRNEDFHRQALRLLNLILDRLPPGSPNPN